MLRNNYCVLSCKDEDCEYCSDGNFHSVCNEYGYHCRIYYSSIPNKCSKSIMFFCETFEEALAISGPDKSILDSNHVFYSLLDDKFTFIIASREKSFTLKGQFKQNNSKFINSLMLVLEIVSWCLIYKINSDDPIVIHVRDSSVARFFNTMQKEYSNIPLYKEIIDKYNFITRNDNFVIVSTWLSYTEVLADSENERKLYDDIDLTAMYDRLGYQT